MSRPQVRPRACTSAPPSLSFPSLTGANPSCLAKSATGAIASSSSLDRKAGPRKMRGYYGATPILGRRIVSRPRRACLCTAPPGLPVPSLVTHQACYWAGQSRNRLSERLGRLLAVSRVACPARTPISLPPRSSWSGGSPIVRDRTWEWCVSLSPQQNDNTRHKRVPKPVGGR